MTKTLGISKDVARWIRLNVTFTRVVRRILNCDKIQDDILTLDEVLNLNNLIHGSPFCVIIYTSYKLSKMCSFYSATLYNDCTELVST